MIYSLHVTDQDEPSEILEAIWLAKIIKIRKEGRKSVLPNSGLVKAILVQASNRFKRANNQVLLVEQFELES
jgi:hypothetical protein